MKRRSFLTSAAALCASPLFANNTPVHTPKGRAEHCIFIWLGGGMAQIDTFDPKKLGDNKSKQKIAGSMYKEIETSVPGVKLTEHLSRTAKVMEHVTVMRTVNHAVIDEHAFATKYLTGYNTVQATHQFIVPPYLYRLGYPFFM